MCQSIEDGGKRCDISKQLKIKISKRKYMEVDGKDIPDSLNSQIKELTVAHQEQNAKVKEREVRKQGRIELEKQRAVRRVAREERKNNEELLKKERLLSNKEKARNPSQVYLSRKESKELRKIATDSFIEEKKENGTLNSFLNLAAERKAKKENSIFTKYEDWAKEHGEDPKKYLDYNKLDIREAGKLTRERIYDGIRNKIEGKVSLSTLGSATINGDFHRDKPERSVCGRVHTNYGSSDASTRSEKVDLLLTDEGRYRIERISQIFKIKESDAIRNQALGIDHREHQYHQAQKAYDERREHIAKYEKEGGLYREQGESLESLYERLINDDSIII